MSSNDHQAGSGKNVKTSVGEETPTGENQGQFRSFIADEVARAFGVALDRVHRAFEGEFQKGPDDTIDSKQAQHLAELILGDQPLDRQAAALMKLGAFTPRYDTLEPSVLEKRPGEQSDRLRGPEKGSAIAASQEDGE
jgi:hypothetical protein